MTAPLVEVAAVSRTYQMRAGLFGRPVNIDAVDKVGFSIQRGESLGIVGESGSG